MSVSALLILRLAAGEPGADCLAELDAALESVADESEPERELDLPEEAEAVLDQVRAARTARSLEALRKASREYDDAAMRFSRTRNKECPRTLRNEFLRESDDLMYELEIDTVRKVLADMLVDAREGERVSVSTELGELPMFPGTAWEQEIAETFDLVTSLDENRGLAYAQEVRARIVELARSRATARKAYSDELEILAPIFEEHLELVERAVSSTVLVRAFDVAKGGQATRVEWADPRFNELMSLIAVLREDELSEKKLEAARQRLLAALGDWQEKDVHGEAATKVRSYLNYVEMLQRRHEKLSDDEPPPPPPEDVKRRRRLVAGWVGGSVLVAGGVSGLAVIEGLRSNGWHDADGRDRQLVLSQWGPAAMGASIAALAVGAVVIAATTANDCARRHTICRRKKEPLPTQARRTIVLPGSVLVRF